MIWHPLTWAFGAAAATGLLLYTSAALRAMDIVLNWSPGSADIDQLRRERRSETANLLGHWALGCLVVAAMLGLLGIGVAWYRIVPGAMCGTGVLQAMYSAGSRAMIFWGLALFVLYAWRVLERLDSQHPQGLLIPAAARVKISAAPFLALALFYAWQAIVQVDSVAPVSCCAAVYDQVLDSTGGPGDRQPVASIFLLGSLAGSVVLVGLAAMRRHSPDRGAGLTTVAVALLWTIAATIAIKQVWAAYYYQVLSHPCPWCLFLPDYYGAGFVIFGCMAVVLTQCLAIWIADRVGHRHPPLADAAHIHIQQAARRVIIAMVVYTILTTGPAIVWRLRTGTWLDSPF